MGGNNPLIVWDKKDLKSTALHLLNSAFITAGQRCTCARRLILPKNQVANDLIEELISLCKKIYVNGYPSEKEPFMGPVICEAAGDKALLFQNKLKKNGAESILEMETLGKPNLLSPGILDVSRCLDPSDDEIFAPLLQLYRVSHFEEALDLANSTKYGLAASLFSDDVKLWEKFYKHCRAGVLNWNRPTTGASSRQPFGGVGLSGNYRPSAYFAADYCAYPVASQLEPELSDPPAPPKGLYL